MKGGFPFAGCHKRLLYPRILRDMTHAAFQMRPCRGQNRRSERRSNTTNASVKDPPPVLDRPLAREDLGFHAALAYKYSGERRACKVALVSCRAEPGPLIGNLESANGSE